MNKKDLKQRNEVIRQLFHDNRKLECEIPKEDLKLDDCKYEGGEIFKTEDGEFVNLEIQMKDFDAEEITKYIEFAEKLYEKHYKHISIYIICPKNIDVCVKEDKILSEASFTIKLTRTDEDFEETLLNYIKDKVNNGKKLTYEDLRILRHLPLECRKEKRNYFREEYFKLMYRII